MTSVPSTPNGAANGWLKQLEETDRWLASRPGGWSSLDPAVRSASPLVKLAESSLQPQDPLPLCHAFSAGLGRLVRVQAEHFPDNLFCDLDFMCSELLRQARSCQGAPVRELEQSFALLEELNALFGCHSTIRFRYLHDFLYGWDWARWVAQDPEPRHGHGPFSTEFLVRLLQRGRELKQLISRQDRRYHRLEPGHFRNPFVFRREPEAEARLHRALAGRGLLPLPGWLHDARPDWNRGWNEIRVDVARELGLHQPR